MAMVLSSSRISDIQNEEFGIQFISNWLNHTPSVHYIHLTNRPTNIVCVDASGREIAFRQEWIAEQNLLRLQGDSIGEPLRFDISVH